MTTADHTMGSVPLETQRARMRLRASLLKTVAGCVVFAVVGFAVYEWQAPPSMVSTDDAYVGAIFAQITPQIDGTISAIRAHDTQYVHKGDVLVALDPKDAQLDFDSARAAYEAAHRRLQQGVADTSAAEANVLAKQSLVAQAEQQLRRRTGIKQPGRGPQQRRFRKRPERRRCRQICTCPLPNTNWPRSRAITGNEDRQPGRHGREDKSSNVVATAAGADVNPRAGGRHCRPVAGPDWPADRRRD